MLFIVKPMQDDEMDTKAIDCLVRVIPTIIICPDRLRPV